MFKSGAKVLEFELKALILRFKEVRVALGDKKSRDKRMWLTGVWRGLFG